MTQPTVPPKPCVEYGCMNLALNGQERCHYHHNIRKAVYRDENYKTALAYGICHICGEDGADTRDHVIPISRGGTNSPANLKPAHRGCNSSKGRLKDRPSQVKETWNNGWENLDANGWELR